MVGENVKALAYHILSNLGESPYDGRTLALRAAVLLLGSIQGLAIVANYPLLSILYLAEHKAHPFVREIHGHDIRISIVGKREDGFLAQQLLHSLECVLLPIPPCILHPLSG